MSADSMQDELPLVLVVDDDETMRFLAGEALRQSGFSMVGARDGLEALALFQSLRPQIVLMDVRMPGIDGFKACESLRRTPGGESVPVVMMTALEDVESINRAYETGATDFITKPINWIILGQRVRYMIRASRTANDLRRSEAKNMAILNAIPDLIFRMNAEGVFLEVRGARGIELPLLYHEPMERQCSTILPLEISEPLMKYIPSALESGDVHVFEFALPVSGKNRCFEARIAASDKEEVLCIIRDISERKELEEDILKAKKIETIGILAGGIAHDYNNLLTVILASINMVQMQADPTSTDYRRLCEAEKATLLARDLTKQFITLSTHGMPSKKTVPIETLVKEAVWPGVCDARLSCTYSFPDGLWSILVDEVQMHQAIGNIIVNAREAMPRGGAIEISAQNTEVKLQDLSAPSPMKEGKYVKLSIIDHGPGIARHNLERVFDPYFSTKERGSQKGMGLGLTVAYAIVRKHGGHISLESELNRGTALHLFLPARERQTAWDSRSRSSVK
jgi:two-component system, cell cycle sensor histidine kinase and response regulator CckA